MRFRKFKIKAVVRDKEGTLIEDFDQIPVGVSMPVRLSPDAVIFYDGADSPELQLNFLLIQP